MTKERSLRVLLIEDEPADCTAISNSIDKKEGICLIGATGSIEKALQEVKDSQPDVIILDIELHKGEGDGITFMERLESSNLIKPFVLVTSVNSSKIIYDRVRGLGVDFIISKAQDNYNADYVIDFIMSLKNAILLDYEKTS